MRVSTLDGAVWPFPTLIEPVTDPWRSERDCKPRHLLKARNGPVLPGRLSDLAVETMVVATGVMVLRAVEACFTDRLSRAGSV